VAASAVVAAVGVAVSAQTPAAPASTSAPKAKALVTALAAKKLEAFAARDTTQDGRYLAVLVVPNVQLLIVSARYERASDIEYRLYHKDYQTAYADLRASVLSKDRVLIEDAFCDGLVAQPPKKTPVFDYITVETEKHIFDGAFADPRRRNDTRITLEEYTKRFTAADERYTRLLTMLIDALK
jgi:hypothetical protein